MTFGEKIHLLRRRQRWSQADLAKRVELNKNYLARLERDEVNDPGSKAVLRLAQVLGVTVDYLLVDKDEEKNEQLATVAS
jgi:transcriptional regulator with XRE-family HTH domain